MRDGALGTCDPACKVPTSICNASNHCVGCAADTDCPLGQRCNIVNDSIANCIPGCMDDSRCHMQGDNSTKACCNKQCVDTATDPDNCGKCGMSCDANHAVGSCAAGKCMVGSCNPGWGDCNNDGTDGCETNLHLDENNCTQCGMQCSLVNAVNGCSDGCYIKACTFGWDDCNQNMDDGCETSVLTDTSNCGACGMPCNGLPNANAQCTAGNCVLGTCLNGFFDCNHMPMDGCESNILSDANNCNGCGNVCPQNNPYCNMGVCGQVPPAVTYTGMFVQNQTPGQACTDWKTFQAALKNGPYVSVTIKGSNDMVGSTCNGAGANTICQALRNNQSTSVMCSGKTWTTGPCGPGTEVSSTGSNCACNNGYTARPCIGNLNWGGVNGVTCTAPTQTITVICSQ
jgi:Cys-rich repeat protein